MTMLTASMLLDPAVLQDPYDFYATLGEQAPIWAVPGTDVVVISTFALLSEAVARPEDFSSTMHCLLYRDWDGLPARLDFGDRPWTVPRNSGLGPATDFTGGASAQSMMSRTLVFS
jgi:hypothetical protein